MSSTTTLSEEEKGYGGGVHVAGIVTDHEYKHTSAYKYKKKHALLPAMLRTEDHHGIEHRFHRFISTVESHGHSRET